MSVVVSSKYQVVIPENIRKSAGIKPGQRVEIIKYGNHMAIVPVPDPKSMRGFLKGMNIDGYRDKKDRF